MKEYRLNQRLSVSRLEEVGNLIGLYEEVFADAFDNFAFRRWLVESDPERGAKALRIHDYAEDGERALFEISYLLSPAHPLSFSGRSFPSLESFGRWILNGAPEVDEPFVRLLTKGYLSWAMTFLSLDRSRPLLYQEVRALEVQSRHRPLESFFDLGYLFSGEEGFFFEGVSYPSLRDFFLEAEDLERILSSYDFLTMPYLASYAKKAGVTTNLATLQSLAEDAREKYRVLLSLNRR